MSAKTCREVAVFDIGACSSLTLGGAGAITVCLSVDASIACGPPGLPFLAATRIGADIRRCVCHKVAYIGGSHIPHDHVCGSHRPSWQALCSQVADIDRMESQFLHLIVGEIIQTFCLPGSLYGSASLADFADTRNKLQGDWKCIICN